MSHASSHLATQKSHDVGTPHHPPLHRHGTHDLNLLKNSTCSGSLSKWVLEPAVSLGLSPLSATPTECMWPRCQRWWCQMRLSCRAQEGGLIKMGREELLREREIKTCHRILRPPHCLSAQDWPPRSARWAHKGTWQGVWLLIYVSTWLGYDDQSLGQSPV